MSLNDPVIAGHLQLLKNTYFLFVKIRWEHNIILFVERFETYHL